MRSSVLALLLLVSPLSAAGKAADPMPLTPAVRDSAMAEIEKDRKDTMAWLERSPTSYLAAIVRRDFGDGETLTLGRASTNDVRIDDPDVRPEHLRVTVVGDSFRVETIDPAARFVAAGDTLTRAVLGPSGIGLGRFSVRLSHQRFPALIVFDPQSPRFKEYKGIPYFPPDLSLRYALQLTPNPEPDTTVILSTRGNQRNAIRVGWFEFKVKGKAVKLEAHRLLEPGVGENDFGIFFRDRTSGKDSYELGRYVNATPLPDGRFLLDFNLAYSPACAYSPHYNCPIPPRANRLDIAIRAGEMDPHYMDH